MSEKPVCEKKNVCEICKEQVSKYKCPRCELKTCSLPCVKKHKTLTECDGRRDRAAFVGLGEFSERHLLNDYVFLEQATRTTELASKSWFVRQRDRPKHLVSLIREAFQRGTKVYLLPFGTTRRMNNASFFHFGERVLYWQVEWLFLDAGAKFTEKKVSEKLPLAELLEQRFCTAPDLLSTADSALERQRLAKYLKRPTRKWRLHLLQEKRRADQPRYWRLDNTDTLQQALKGTVITEHPRIYVTLPESKFKFKLMKGSKEKKRKKESEKQASSQSTGDDTKNSLLPATDVKTENAESEHTLQMEAEPAIETDACRSKESSVLDNCKQFINHAILNEKEEGEMSD